MDTNVAKSIIGVIRAERDSRLARLKSEDPEEAHYTWLFIEEPLINELCLMLLVAIRHNVERELVWVAARVTGDGREIDEQQYRQLVQNEREQIRHGRWESIKAKLRLATFAEWDSSMKTLQLLANTYKHNPSTTPDKALLKHLGLDLGVKYATVPESQDLKRGLAVSLGLQQGADFCDIADELLIRAGRFLAEVQAHSVLSPVKRRAASVFPSDLLH